MSVINSNTITVLVTGCFACWIFGYALGHSMAWVRKLRDVA